MPPKGTRPCKIARPASLAADLATGKTYTELAAKYGVSRNTLTKWAQSAEVIAEVEGIHASTAEAMAKEITAGAVEGIHLLRRMARGDNPEITAAAQVMAASKLVDLAGAGKPQRIEVSSIQSMSDDEIGMRLEKLRNGKP